MTMPIARERVLEDADLGAVGLLDARELGRDSLGQHVDDVALGIVLLENGAQVRPARAHEAGRQEAAPHGEQVRHEGHREAELRGDLGCVLVHPDLVRRDVLEDDPGVRRRLWGPPCTGHPRLRVHDDAGRLDLGRDRPEREQDSRRVAAGIGDETPARRAQLRETVRPRPERPRSRVLEPVPVAIHLRVGEAVCAGQVDDDAAHRRLEPGSFRVREAEERDVGAGVQCRLVRDEPRHPAPAVAAEPRIERRRGLAGEGVRPECVQLECRVREDAVQRLLADVAGGADDGDARHSRIMHMRAILCVSRPTKAGASDKGGRWRG